MKELQNTITQLESEIAENWNETQRQFHLVKTKIKNAITSPVVLLTAATAGAAVGRKIRGKNSFSLQKIVTTLSEISTAVNLIKYLRKTT